MTLQELIEALQKIAEENPEELRRFVIFENPNYGFDFNAIAVEFDVNTYVKLQENEDIE